jgi:hypothetical protein
MMTPLKVERGKGNIFFGLQVLAGLMDVFNFGDKWQQKSETYTVSPHLASNSSTSLTDFLARQPCKWIPQPLASGTSNTILSRLNPPDLSNLDCLLGVAHGNVRST